MGNAEQFGDELRKFAADAVEDAIANTVIRLVVDGAVVVEVPFQDGDVDFPGYRVEEAVPGVNATVELVTPDGQKQTTPVKATKL